MNSPAVQQLQTHSPLVPLVPTTTNPGPTSSSPMGACALPLWVFVCACVRLGAEGPQTPAGRTGCMVGCCAPPREAVCLPQGCMGGVQHRKPSPHAASAAAEGHTEVWSCTARWLHRPTKLLFWCPFGVCPTAGWVSSQRRRMGASEAQHLALGGGAAHGIQLLAPHTPAGAGRRRAGEEGVRGGRAAGRYVCQTTVWQS
jgi:hypothetical protein